VKKPKAKKLVKAKNVGDVKPLISLNFTK
jgi:hypothetical protein